MLVSLWWNWQLRDIINKINTGTHIPTDVIIMAATAILFSMASAYALSLCSAWACECMAHDLRMGFAKHFATLSLTEIENISAGEQLSKLQNEISEVNGFLQTNLFTFADDIIRFIGTFSWLLWLDPKLTLVSNIPTAVLVWYTVYTSRVISEAAQQSQQANGQMNGFAGSLIAVFPVMKLFDAVQLISDKYDAALVRWERAVVTEERRRAVLMSLSGLMSCSPFFGRGDRGYQGNVVSRESVCFYQPFRQCVRCNDEYAGAYRFVPPFCCEFETRGAFYGSRFCF